MEMHDMQEGLYSECTQEGTTIKIYLSRLHTQSKGPRMAESGRIINNSIYKLEHNKAGSRAAC